ncbi:MAG: 3-deoxy-7-phosphoheptulonate synthase [Methyloprofundus sp.]|nr:3-deoxy-7-phosphoheptulonate synthase [Methyloprofundus sp.]
MQSKTDNLRIRETKELMAPIQAEKYLPLSELASKTTIHSRNVIHDILNDKDDRLLVIVGPCSIHDPKAALEYAELLKSIKQELNDDLHIVMRVYFEKPRTTVGWKGLINDPDLDNSFNINKGLSVARKLLIDLNEQGIPAATEYLDLITPQYVSDLIAWGAIGARTTESQCHRELASGLSCPVGFKNATDGGVGIAVDAIKAAMNPHHFLSVTKEGHSAIFSTSGNPDVHMILRGGHDGPNYDAVSVNKVGNNMTESDLKANIMIDLSHANSLKQCHRQPIVAKDVADQIAGGEHRIMGVMIESHLKSGRQDLGDGKDLTYGQSITDACIDWDETVQVLKGLATAVQQRRTVKD